MDEVKELVVHSSDARWMGPEFTKNPGSIGILDTIPARNMWFGLQDIPQGEATDLHRHTHESVHCVTEGEGYSEIGPERVEWKAGDFVYTPPNIWHRHYNTGPTAVRMIVVENTGLLEFLGIAKRESAGTITYDEFLRRQEKP